MNCKYYITVEGTRSEIQRDELKNWDEVEYTLKRNDFSGVVRSFSSSFEFVGDIAENLKSAFEKRKLFTEAFIEVFTIDNTWREVPAFACPFDFASYEETSGVVRISTIDNSLAAIIKANKGNKFDFQMSEFTDSADKSFRYNGIELDNMVSYRIGEANKETGVVEFTTLEGGEYQKLPVNVVENDVVEGKSLSWTNQPQEVFKVKSYAEQGEAGVVPSDRGFPYGSFTNGDYKLLKNLNEDSSFFGNVRIRVYADVDIKLPNNVSEFEMWVCTTTPTGDVVNYPNFDYGVGMFKLEKNADGHYILDNKHYNLYSDYNLVLLAKIVSAGTAKISINSCTFYVTWPGHNKPSYIDYVTPKSLLNKLVGRMIDGRSGYSCEIQGLENNISPYEYSMLGSWDTDARLAHTILVPKDAVTNNPDNVRFIRTSFDDFCKWMETVFGYIYYIEGTKIIFCHRTKVFQDGEPKVIGKANDLAYRVNQKVVVSNLEIGYEVSEKDAFNMKYEFNRKSTYSTGIVNTEKKISLISPYYADSVGFDLAYRSGLKTAADEKNSQDGIWCVMVKESLDVGKTVYVADTNVQLDSHSEIKDGMFNFYLSPVFCLKANSYYLSSFFEKLKLTSANVNDIKLQVDFGYLSMKRDYLKGSDDCSFYKYPLFSIGILSFMTNDQCPPLDLSKPVSVEWNGCRYTGYIDEIRAKYEREESTDYKLIVKNVVQI